MGLTTIQILPYDGGAIHPWIICLVLTISYEEFLWNIKVSVQNGNLFYYGSYLAMPKSFGQSCIKKLNIAKNVIGEGILVQNFKASGQETSFGDPLLFEKCYQNVITYFLWHKKTNRKKSFV